MFSVDEHVISLKSINQLGVQSAYMDFFGNGYVQAEDFGCDILFYLSRAEIFESPGRQSGLQGSAV